MFPSLSIDRGVRHLPMMVVKTDEDVSERRLVGRALKNLRDRSGLSQEDAAEAFAQIARPRGKDEFTGQAWGAYETGTRKGVHAPALQAKLAAAVGANREELQLEIAKLRGGRPAAIVLDDRTPRPFNDFPPARTQRMTMPDDNLRPWAKSGDTIVYDVDRWPEPNEGCVLEALDGGRKQVKLFLRADSDNFYLAEIFPERREFTLPRAEFNAYRVAARMS